MLRAARLFFWAAELLLDLHEWRTTRQRWHIIRARRLLDRTGGRRQGEPAS
jgi:hypothetical protein